MVSVAASDAKAVVASPTTAQAAMSVRERLTFRPMKTPFRLVALLGLSALTTVVYADPLDDLIADRKSGVTRVDPAKQQATLQAGLSRASSAHAGAMANSYLAQVKSSIIDPENHGGWPCRSSLVFQPTTRRMLTAILKSRFERQPDAILAYAVICPAIYERNTELMDRAIDYLKKNDPFLHDLAQEQMSSFWLPFISTALRKQAPAKKDVEAKDDPFSVLPR